MSKDNITGFVCTQCGYYASKWLGRCPLCGQWNSFEEKENIMPKKEKKNLNIGTVNLSSVSIEPEFRFSTGFEEFDRVLGGGIVKASSVLVGGEPGIGKSTLMLQMSANCITKDSVIYVSGEENPSQIRQRAERLCLNLEKINIFNETKLELIINLVNKEKPRVLIVDSLQTIESEELSTFSGSVGQMRMCCSELTNVCKKNGTSVFFIGHVTKEGTIAGPKIIEHLVDTVIYFEEAEAGVRIIRAVKNRFGSIDEIGIFKMTKTGLIAVSDPSGAFISFHDNELRAPGIAYTAVSEGSRTFLVEIQALVVRAKSGISRVYSDKIDSSKVMRITAILEKHANVNFSDKDIYVNVAGGIKVNDVSVELALAFALCSAFFGSPLPVKTVCFGELSLAGEIRGVSCGERRLKAAENMGFDRAVVPKGMNLKKSGQTITEYSKISEAVEALLG